MTWTHKAIDTLATAALNKTAEWHLTRRRVEEAASRRGLEVIPDALVTEVINWWATR